MTKVMALQWLAIRSKDSSCIDPPTAYSPQKPTIQKKKRPLRFLAGSSGGCGMLFALPLLLMFLVEFVQLGSGMDNFNGAIGASVFSAVVACFSALMLFYAFKPAKEIPFALDAHTERQILGLANGNQGTLSLAFLVMNSPLSAEQAQISLDEMVRKGLATSTFDHEGLISYRFAGLSRGPAHVSHQGSQAQADLDAFDRELSSTEFDFQQPESSQQHAPHHSHKKNS